ncbi:hypothetical protein [Deinococcus soli (ex Cha et al. 2016)]|uniref:Uncharacterized protein n=2 Tax=Deinococcus soli (ex Cha et al. 2016) TaxID=1309411 RepID=A0AAE4BL53_9DEIO|nr:hypothetical protein [Deinococcus soli (ex Cha et al. 2016)]MDR6218553.1 hypothetical protein [Deinococcus soli (ex Cha et al. 2016)]MDR6329293.1 hypothetical protein [Deinococcus soli (ex Cha et al. 2016)]MDR6751566.1 hypothetical protein [Deinococcus soli (ex Cha et al. 2016)]
MHPPLTRDAAVLVDRITYLHTLRPAPPAPLGARHHASLSLLSDEDVLTLLDERRAQRAQQAGAERTGARIDALVRRLEERLIRTWRPDLTDTSDLHARVFGADFKGYRHAQAACLTARGARS